MPPHTPQPMSHPDTRHTTSLVLMGGGARTAYQVGALRGIAALLRLQRPSGQAPFPFQVLVGTSAGALNTAFLASKATAGMDAIDHLAEFWGGLRSEAVFRLELPLWVRVSRLAAAMRLWVQARRHGALLDTMPLVSTLHRQISLEGIERSLQQGAIEAVAVTASSYTTGVHWTFCHMADGARRPPHRCGWTGGASTSATARCARSRPWHRPCTWARVGCW